MWFSVLTLDIGRRISCDPHSDLESSFDPVASKIGKAMVDPTRYSDLGMVGFEFAKTQPENRRIHNVPLLTEDSGILDYQYVTLA